MPFSRWRRCRTRSVFRFLIARRKSPAINCLRIHLFGALSLGIMWCSCSERTLVRTGSQMLSQGFPYFDGPRDISSSSNGIFVRLELASSASSPAPSFTKHPAWLLIFIKSIVPGHKRNSLSRRTRMSKCTMSVAGLWLEFRLSPFYEDIKKE
jgi:hypothetical protein